MTTATLPMTQHTWQTRAACRGADPMIFFGGPDNEGSAYRTELFIEQAKTLCANCPVRQMCLENAMTVERGCGRTNRFGIFGGLDRDERFALQRERDAA